MISYVVAKDFAGPISTLVAAAAATYLAFTFQSKQTAIARNKLSLEVFDKKYKIYECLKDLLVLVIVSGHEIHSIDNSRIRDLRIEIDEARFFFSQRILHFIKSCDKACEDYLTHVAFGPASEEARSLFAEEAAHKSAAVRALYVQVPSRFEAEMRIFVP